MLDVGRGGGGGGGGTEVGSGGLLPVLGRGGTRKCEPVVDLVDAVAEGSGGAVDAMGSALGVAAAVDVAEAEGAVVDPCDAIDGAVRPGSRRRTNAPATIATMATTAMSTAMRARLCPCARCVPSCSRASVCPTASSVADAVPRFGDVGGAGVAIIVDASPS